jgi:hypothetical protein
MKRILTVLMVVLVMAFGQAALADQSAQTALQDAAATLPTYEEKIEPMGIRFSTAWVSKYVGYLGPEVTTEPVVQTELSWSQYTSRGPR